MADRLLMSHQVSNRGSACSGPPSDALVADRSDWTRISVLVLAGIASAMQIGKVPAALSLLQADFNVGLVASAWILSMFSGLGALFGSLAGLLAARCGSRHVTVASLLVMALASAGGASAHSAAL